MMLESENYVRDDMINVNSPIKVRFKEPFFDDDFTEVGVVGYITDIALNDHRCLEVKMDFSEFTDINTPILKSKREYYPNSYTPNDDREIKLYDCFEAGHYKEQAIFYYGCLDSLSVFENISLLNEYVEFL